MLPSFSDWNCREKSIHILNWIVTGEALSSDNSIENADLIGTAVSFRQEETKKTSINNNIPTLHLKILHTFFYHYISSLSKICKLSLISLIYNLSPLIYKGWGGTNWFLVSSNSSSLITSYSQTSLRAL